MINYYSVLGVSEAASDQEIRAAYNRVLQESLMDQDRFTSIKEAYEVLGNPQTRQTYDRDRLTPPGPASLAATPAAPPSAPVPAATTLQATAIMPPPDQKTGTAPLRRTVAGDATVAMLPAQCAVCGHLNPPGEIYCVECGFLLSSPAEKGAALPSEDDLKRWPHLEDDSGQIYVLKPGPNTVGRENADIRIGDKTASRHHATIIFHEDRGLFSVEDKGSTNGTAVNGQALPAGVPHPIHSGDQVRFGSFMMSLVAPDAHPAETTRVVGDEYGDDDLDVDTIEPEAAAEASEVPSGALGRLTLAQGFGPREIAIERGVTTVGRLPDNMLSLKHDRYVSGHHARIVAEEGVFRLIDVGSTNGTMLNGLRLTTNEAIAISEGDEISFGGTIYQFHVNQPPSEADSESVAEPDTADLPITKESA